MDFEFSNDGDKDVAFCAWKDMGLTTRTAWVLANNGINSIDALLTQPENVMLRWANFGRKSLNELYEFLDREGHPRPKKMDRPWPNAEAELANLYAKLAGHMKEVGEIKQRIAAIESAMGA